MSVAAPSIATIAGPSPTETETAGAATSPAGDGQPGEGGTNSDVAGGGGDWPPGTGVIDGSSMNVAVAAAVGAEEGTVAWHAARSTVSTNPDAFAAVEALLIEPLNQGCISDQFISRPQGFCVVSPRMPSEMTATPLPDLILYTRPGCGLCDETRSMIQSLLEDRAARGARTAHLRERDIGSDAAIERELFDRIPVVELRGRRLELAISAAKLRRFLDDGLDGTMA
jgi:hypothetical protein